MGNRKDIGKLFNEQFKGFEQAPDAGLWDTIASELDQKPGRRIAPFWFYFGGLLLVGMLTSIWVWQPWNTSKDTIKENQQLIVDSTIPENNNENTTTTNDYITNNTTSNSNTKEIPSSGKTTITTQTLVTGKENTISTNNTLTSNVSSEVSRGTKNSNQTPSISHSNSTNSKTPAITSSNNSSNYSSGIIGQSSNVANQESLLEALRTMKSTTQIAREQKELEARDTYQAKIDNELAQAITLQKEESKVAAQKWFDSIANLETIKKAKLAAKEEEKSKVDEKLPKLPKTEEEREKNRKESVEYKLAISPYTSILSYGSLTKGSSIDDRLVNNPRDAVGTIGYGIRADYKFSEKSSLRFGIGLAPLQYRTSDFQVLITNNGNVNIFQLSGINLQNLGQAAGIETSPEALSFFSNNDVVSIEQDISYVEVPIDYQYRLLNKRVSLSFNTGLSLFVLTNNRVFATANSGESIFIGRETSLNDLSLAINLGLGTHYNFSKKWRFDVEPAFKYQLNPYTDNIGNFKPYYFGLQFGMSYKF